MLLARVRALPEDGAANAALIALLAKSLKLPKSNLTLASGGKGRVKTVVVTGDPEALSDALARLESRLAGSV